MHRCPSQVPRRAQSRRPLATLEFVLNPDRVTPAVSASFSMTMLLNTPAGDAHTFAELESILHDADFTTNEIHQVPPSPQQLNVSR